MAKEKIIQLSKIEEKDYAEMEFPPIVYKYRDWADPMHKTIITKREVFFASPNSFTDPFDCKIPIRHDLLNYADVKQKISKDHPEWNSEQRNGFIKDWFGGHRDEIMKLQEKNMSEFMDRFGVLSLTEIPDNNFMWFMYADNFRGFCIGFVSNIMFPHLKGGGGPVVYYDTLPVIYPTPKNLLEEQHYLQIFSKLKEWEFEHEYRTHIFSQRQMSINDRKRVIPPEAFKEIIFGKNMLDNIKEDLLNNIPNELGHIKLKEQEPIC